MSKLGHPVVLAVATLAALASAPPAQDARTRDQVARERAANLKCYVEHYVERKEWLYALHVGKWVAIAGGVLLPENDGRIEPVDSLDEIDRIARQHAPDARHRFVFRIGEEGELMYRRGMADVPNLVSANLPFHLARESWVTSRSVLVKHGDGVVDLSVATGDPRPFMPLGLSAPLGEATREQAFLVSTVFAGTALLDARRASELQLEQWEIPGLLRIRETETTCRRARVTFRIAKLERTITLPVGVWRE